MNILITGGNGFIAKNLKKYLKDLYNIDTISRQDFNLLDTSKVNEFFSDKFYDVIIHTAILGGSRLEADSSSIVNDNITMIHNIISNKAHYKRLINLGSGAELLYPETPYGMSKRMIADIVNDLDNHYNLRIFALFNEDELETRFIKSNIIRYLNKQDLIIHQNKYMDFFGFGDFVKLIKLYVEEEAPNLKKTLDCCYSKKYTLEDIANIINNLDNYSVNIKIIQKENLGVDYTGEGNSKYELNYMGLKNSIVDMFKLLKNKYNNI